VHVVLSCERLKVDLSLLYRLDESLRKLNYMKQPQDLVWLGQVAEATVVASIRTAKADFARCAAQVGITVYGLRVFASKTLIVID